MTDSISIPGYRIARKLGQGGMASVYLAIQESFDREVALKVMSPFLNSDPSFATRFLREARIVAQIHHSSIVPVMDVGQHGGLHYLSMEYLPGGDLKQRIVEGRHGANLALNVCVAISSALDLAHRKGFVHRDIKPENVLFREDGTPVLTDFGIARAIDAGTQLTMAGTMVGTPNYMSPEQVKGAELDGRSDLYSLGVVFYEMLTGLVPFRADSTMSLAMKHLSEPLPLLPQQFAVYQPFLDRLMAKDRNDRFATGAEVIRALRLITDMAIARESTLMRNRANPSQSGMDMPTLVSPTPLTGSMGVPASAAEGGTVRIPSTATQPSGIMQIPIAPQATQMHGSSAEVVPPTPMSAAVAADAQAGDMTVPRPPAEKSGAQPEPKAAAKAKPPAVPRKPNVPLQMRVRGWVQRISSSKHSTWVGFAAITLLAIGAGYLLGRTTDMATAPVADQVAPPTAKSQTKVAMAVPAPVQAIPVTNTVTPTAAETTESTVATPPSAAAAPEAASTEGNTSAVEEAKRAAKEEARRKEEEARAKRLEQQRLREEAQRKLAAEQRETNLQAQREREAKIKELLVLAKSDIAQGNLVSPENNNAVARYREVLSKDPGQAEALEARNGLKRITDVLVEEAYRALTNGSKETAGKLIDSLRWVQSDHPELSKLQVRLQGSENSKSLSRTQQNNLRRAMERCESLLSRTPQSLSSITDAVKEYDKAQVISNVASGLSILRARIEEAFVAGVQTEMSSGNAKQAREIIAIARLRGWLTPDLLQLEQAMDATQSP